MTTTHRHNSNYNRHSDAMNFVHDDEVVSPLSAVSSSLHHGAEARNGTIISATLESQQREPALTAVAGYQSATSTHCGPWPAQDPRRATTPVPRTNYGSAHHYLLDATTPHHLLPVPSQETDTKFTSPQQGNTDRRGDGVLDLNKYKVCLSSPEHRRRSQSARSVRSARHSRTSSLADAAGGQFHRCLSSTAGESEGRGAAEDGLNTPRHQPLMPEVSDGEVPSPLTPPRTHSHRGAQGDRNNREDPSSWQDRQDTKLSSTNAENEKLRADLAMALSRISALESMRQSHPEADAQHSGNIIHSYPHDHHPPRYRSRHERVSSFNRSESRSSAPAEHVLEPFQAPTAASAAKMYPKKHTRTAEALGHRASTPGPHSIRSSGGESCGVRHVRTSSTWSNNFTNVRKLSSQQPSSYLDPLRGGAEAPRRCESRRVAPDHSIPHHRRNSPLPGRPPRTTGGVDVRHFVQSRPLVVGGSRHRSLSGLSESGLDTKESMIAEWDHDVGAAQGGACPRTNVACGAAPRDQQVANTVLVEDLRGEEDASAPPRVRHYYSQPAAVPPRPLPGQRPSSRQRSTTESTQAHAVPSTTAAAAGPQQQHLRRGSGPSKAKIVAGIEAFLSKEDPQRAPHAKTIAQALKFDVLLIRQKLAMDYGLPEKTLQRTYLL